MVFPLLGFINPPVKEMMEILILVTVVDVFYWKPLPYTLKPVFEIINPTDDHVLVIENFKRLKMLA